MYSVDILCFIASCIFFLTTFRKDDCYSPECPSAIKPWLFLTFISFFALQGLTYALFKVKSRRNAFYLWMFNSLVILPSMLALNVWGNMLIEEMDKVVECTYLGFAQSFQMLYLISTYCVIFVYVIFLLTIKETLKRFYAFMERPADQMNQRLNVHSVQVNLVRGRSS